MSAPETPDFQQTRLSFQAPSTSETLMDVDETDVADAQDEDDLACDIEEAALDLSPNRFTVSELTAYLEEVIQADPVLGNTITVQGELSNVSRSARGHIYFTLKDASASIRGIIWASLAANLPFDLEPGQAVYVTGSIELYAPSGTYSIISRSIEPMGVGALQLAFDQTKARLEAEGLFLTEFKKPLPAFPKRIGIITSKTGSVIHDMLRVLHRKHPGVHVLIAPVKVQGPGAAAEIAEAIARLNHVDHALDVIIVARGGGSFEDLFAFSDETVVRAIFQSLIPIISGVGHEPDFSLTDATADHRASTPTAAAEAAVPDIVSLQEKLKQMMVQLVQEVFGILMTAEQHFDTAATAFVNRQTQLILDADATMAQRQSHLIESITRLFESASHRLNLNAAALEAYSPLATLSRGYTIAYDSQGNVLHSAKTLMPQDKLQLQFQDGQLKCEVIDNA